MSDINDKYADRFWSLANAIVAFQIATTVSFVVADATWNGAISRGLEAHPKYGYIGLSVGLVLYVTSVHFCQLWAWKLSFADQLVLPVSKYVRWCNAGRIAAIFLITALGAIPVLEHQVKSAVGFQCPKSTSQASRG